VICSALSILDFPPARPIHCKARPACPPGTRPPSSTPAPSPPPPRGIGQKRIASTIAWRGHRRIGHLGRLRYTRRRDFRAHGRAAGSWGHRGWRDRLATARRSVGRRGTALGKSDRGGPFCPMCSRPFGQPHNLQGPRGGAAWPRSPRGKRPAHGSASGCRCDSVGRSSEVALGVCSPLPALMASTCCNTLNI